MLEKVDLSNKLAKAEYKRRMPLLQERLRVLQNAITDAGVAVTIVLEGWDAAGKGTLIASILERLDPRGFRVRPTYAPTIDELYRPWLWRFWQRLPARGEIAVFDRSWYGRVLVERVEDIMDAEQLPLVYPEINEFERMLTDDGMVLVKCLLHISKKEQRKRFRKAEKDPYTAWKIKPEDWRHHRQYDDYYEAMEEMLAKTSTAGAPWTLVEASDRRWMEVETFTAIIQGVEARLKKLGKLPDANAAKRILKPKDISAATKATRKRPAPVKAGRK